MVAFQARQRIWKNRKSGNLYVKGNVRLYLATILEMGFSVRVVVRAFHEKELVWLGLMKESPEQSDSKLLPVLFLLGGWGDLLLDGGRVEGCEVVFGGCGLREYA